MRFRKSVLLLMIAALCVSVLLPSKASEMSSHLGEQVKAWEPPISLHLRIFFAPLIDVLDAFGGVSEVNERELGEYWTYVLEKMAYWLPITLAGWLMLLYVPVNYLTTRIPKPALRRSVQTTMLLFAIAGTALLTHHLLDWATLYEGQYHMGIGGYFVILAFAALCTLLLHDLMLHQAK
jgi:hypothetical protein